jgi:hypothetical protein
MKAARPTHLSISALIGLLQQAVADGIDHHTLVAIPATNNNCEPGYLQLTEAVAPSKVAKADFDRGYGLCKIGARGGVPVFVIR